jgi:DNA helicase-2/ATP-dependent DNA helicase PcrA
LGWSKLKKNHQINSLELISAVKNGQLSEVKTLLSKGSNPNSTDDFKTSALTFSILNNQLEICLELLKVGANPDLKNHANLSPLDIARQNNYIGFVNLIGTYRFKNKQQYKQKLFPYSKGKNTKKAHIEYKEFPRNHEFEHEYYKDTIKLLNEEIAATKDRLRRRDLGGIDDRSNEALARHIIKRIPRLEEQTKKPYYARLDIKTKNGDINSYYLGSQGMTDDRVYAPQSYLGRLYSQRTLGKVTDNELGEIELTLIRQIENENGQIHQIIDKEWAEETGYVDPILMKRLNDNAKTKMNEIWETIQAEQDTVVRQNISEPIIVQGSAGSGKTVIALHRLSYLLYQYKELVQQKIMILGPNTMYLKYIQDALPHLDVGDIQQTTFEMFCMERIPFEKLGYSIINFHDPIKKGLPEQEIISSKIKGSLSYQKAMKSYLASQQENLLPKEVILVSSEFGNFSFSEERVKGLLRQFNELSTIEVARNRVIEIIKTEVNRYTDKISWKTQNNKTVAKIIKELNVKMKDFINNWQIPNTFELYRQFVTDSYTLKEYVPEKYIENLEEFIDLNKRNLDQFKVTVDDLPALLEIEQWLTGKIGTYDENDSTKITNQKFHYILIDEAQDYSPYQFSVVNSLVKPGRIMILGDLGQSIYDYRGINNWKEAVNAFDITGEGNYTYLELSTIYRSTVQIVKFANEIIRPFTTNRYKLSEPIGRDGVEPSIQAFSGQKNQLLKITSILDLMKEKGQENIAVITRDWDEALKVYSKLKKLSQEIDLVTQATNEYHGGTIVIPVYLTKGIEFDAVILTDASMERYQDDDDHRKLLYVSVTRALHQVFVFYNEMLALPLLDIIDKDKADHVREEIKRNELEEKRRKELEEQKKALEEQSRRELEDAKRLEGMNCKPPFLIIVENEFNKVVNSHKLEVDEFKERISQLESKIKLHKLKDIKKESKSVTQMNDHPIITLQKTALFEFSLNSDRNRIKEFFNSFATWDLDDRLKVQLSTLRDFLLKKNYAVIPELLGFIDDTILSGGFPTNESKHLFMDVFEVILLDIRVDVMNLDEIFLKCFSMISSLADSEMKDYYYDILECNFDYLVDLILEINEMPVLLKTIQLYLEYEMNDKAAFILDRIFEEWEYFDSQLTKEHFVKLLWYSFYSGKDEAFVELAPYEYLDESFPEVRLYYACYDALNGDIKAFSKINDLFNKVKAFSPLEKVILERKINECKGILQST